MNSAWGLIGECQLPTGSLVEMLQARVQGSPNSLSSSNPVGVNDHSPAPPEPGIDESVNSLIVGVFGGFIFIPLSLPRPAVFLPWAPALSQNAHSENTNPFSGGRQDVPASWQALRLPGSGCDLSSLPPYEVPFMQSLEGPFLAL